MKEELVNSCCCRFYYTHKDQEEVGTFNVYDVIEGLNDKLIFRHPHVFGDNQAEDANEALQNWEQMKAEEKEAQRPGSAEGFRAGWYTA